MGKKKKGKDKGGATVKESKVVPAQGLSARRHKDLNFKVPPSYYFYVSNLAAQHGISKIEMLRRAIALYVEKFGAPVLPQGSEADGL